MSASNRAEWGPAAVNYATALNLCQGSVQLMEAYCHSGKLRVSLQLQRLPLPLALRPDYHHPNLLRQGAHRRHGHRTALVCL
jgi:hypothetical protein